MKIIDTHTHLPGRIAGSRVAGPRVAARGAREIRRELEDAGVSGAWIFTHDGLYRDAARHNLALAEAVSRERDFFTPFATVNPHDGPEAVAREIERAVTSLGMPGLKLHPWLQSFSLSHPVVPLILREAGRLGAPVLFHDGSPPYSTPLQVAAAAGQCPETTVILGHAGLDDLYRDAIIACRRHANIHLCCCSLSAGHIREIIAQCPPEKILYGSDAGLKVSPGMVPDALDKVRESGAPESVLRGIFEVNPARLLAGAGTG